MKRTILSLSDFSEQAAAILAASKAKRGDGLRMEVIDNDETDGPDADEEDEEDEDESDDDDDADESSDDDDDKDDKKKSKDKSAEDKVDRAEYDRVKRHRAAADRKVAERDATITDLKTQLAAKDTKADGTTQARVQELEKQTSKDTDTIKTLRIHNAFLAANSHSWHDAADALRLADLSEVEIDPEDGSVTGIKEALDALAKSKPHLIKKPEGDKDESRNASGSSTNGKRKGQQKKTDRATLSKTYPVLATRR